MSVNVSTDWKELRSQYGRLMEQLGEGWESGKPGAIADLFTDDATFLPSPFDPPIKGKTAINDYWKDIPLEQAEVSFRFGEIFVAGPWFATEIRCTFRRRRTGKPVDVRGAIFCETEREKISEMRMYWHRKVG